MKKCSQFVFVLLFFIGAAQCFGANFFVRKGASGANNGTSWTNAWNEMSQIKFSSVSCGDTIWLAGGTYTTDLSVNKTCNSGSPLNINRVLSSDGAATASAGWSSSYDSPVVLQNASINLAAGAFYTINGRKGSVAGNDYGISVRCTSSGGCDGIDGAGSGNLSNVTMMYVELYGPACVESQNCGGSGASGLNVAPSSNRVSYLLFDHGWIHRYGESIRTSNWSDCTIQYSNISDTHNDGQQHEDIVFSYPITNFTMRYNKIWSSPNDGIFFYGNETNTRIYGNVYYHSGAALLTFYAGFTHNVYIYNNVFENDGTFGDYQPGWLYFQGTMTGEIANNIWVNVDSNGQCSVCNHNAYTLGAGSESGSFNFVASNQFVNESAGNPGAADFHLTATGVTAFANKGKALAAPFNVDPDGNTRGADGGWDIGAYEAGKSTGPAAPAPPTGLSGVVK